MNVSFRAFQPAFRGAESDKAIKEAEQRVALGAEMQNHAPVDFKTAYGAGLVLDSLNSQLSNARAAGDNKTVEVLEEAIRDQQAKLKDYQTNNTSDDDIKYWSY